MLTYTEFLVFFFVNIAVGHGRIVFLDIVWRFGVQQTFAVVVVLIVVSLLINSLMRLRLGRRLVNLLPLA